MASHWPPEKLPVKEVRLRLRSAPSLGCSFFTNQSPTVGTVLGFA